MAVSGEASSEEPETRFSGATAAQELDEMAQLPELHLQPIRDQLLLDFYLSFRFSQADEGIQINLFRALIREYRRAGSQPTVEDIKAVKERLPNLRPPAQHAQINESRLGEFDKMWGKLEDAFRLTLGKGLHDGQLVELGESMAERDIKFIDKGRSGRDSGGDSHESFFRTYVLQGAPTKSATYDSIMIQVRSACSKGTETWRPVVQRLIELKAVWEHTHPGEQFYPESESLAEAA